MLWRVSRPLRSRSKPDGFILPCVDRLIAELGRHPLAEGELREVKEGVFVSLNQSQPEGIEYAFCLSSGGRMYFFFRKAG